MDGITYLVINTVSNFIQLYLILIFVRILLSWFQTTDWASNIISFLAPVTDPYLNIFRSFIPPLGGIDFSAILAIFVLQLIPRILFSIVSVI
ncbi:YggT family protein [Geminocystis sp. NIES-3709]|uniref:YggT family protein n=1 Tax=Geminocystis sp. NIES-3709 TaxID=1617448 RepID=UPI0005FC9EE9|nr:YggT family protein [Geminocystis sp. NIES-3709]BAQ66832.1 cell division protein YlmG/Ycf19 [Geminocystis sp. NIES-3709]